MTIAQFVVTAAQMRDIEERIFDAGMPVAALMEKVAGAISRRIQAILKEEGRNYVFNPFSLFPNHLSQVPKIGILVGPGHNGGDALVIARELYFQGYSIAVYCPFAKFKELTGFHANYAKSLGIPFYGEVDSLQDCHILIDGLFGFGLERPLTDFLATVIDEINEGEKFVFSIDIPSGLHTDTGEVLGTAIRATHTFCLGLWKLAFLQDQALEYIGSSELIDFDIPIADILAILGECPTIKRITKESAIASLPLSRHPASHKYKNGHLLLIAGSRRYNGAAILAGLAARASGVGMLSIAVPQSIKPLLTAELPEALIIGCVETENGAIRDLPPAINLKDYDAIAIGPGLTLDAAAVVELILESDRPLVLDADGLNILSHLGAKAIISERKNHTILTPHLGEFKRLFPDLYEETLNNRVLAAQIAAEMMGGIIVLKGAKVAIANPSGYVWLNPESTPALARGGSGDVLTGLLGGLLAETISQFTVESVVQTAVWWHSYAGILAAKDRTELGVDAFTLTQYLIPVLKEVIGNLGTGDR
jgi:ADP-dependent NAD(P)H-hydrate dehydratase / NAD(P)H-hydrate epimerase